MMLPLQPVAKEVPDFKVKDEEGYGNIEVLNEIVPLIWTDNPHKPIRRMGKSI